MNQPPRPPIDFKHFDSERYFARKLHDHGKHVFLGVTDAIKRRERIRAAIIECGLADVTFGYRMDTTKETFREAFERFYRMPLIEPKKTTTTTTPQGENEDGQIGI